MTKKAYKQQLQQIISAILQHLGGLADDVPAFIHIIEAKLNDAFIGHSSEKL